VDAVANTKIYGADDPTFTATLSGFVGTDNASNSGITGSASCTRTTGEDVNGSPYTINCTPGTLEAPNYSFLTGATAGFTINKASSVTAVSCPVNVTYTGAALTPCTATVTGVGGVNQSLTVSYSNNTNAGTAAASASYPGDDNHLGSSDSKNFTIDKAASATTVICPASVIFTGLPLTPCSAAVTGAGGLNQSLTVSYSNNTNVGTATASATYAGDANHFGSDGNKTFSILAWTLKGFYQPVDMGAYIFNLAKGGSTVPLKFEVFAGATELTATSAVKSFVQTKIACDTSATLDEIEITTTGSTSLRYDATSGQFIQNWQTPKQAGACYRVTMTTQDGLKLEAFFKLK
jgi:hypothetical protein